MGEVIFYDLQINHSSWLRPI